MHYYEVAPTQVIRAKSATFTYAAENALAIGSLVTIEVGKKILPGVLIKEVVKPSYSTKLINSVLTYKPLPAPLIKTALWMSDYYATHLAVVLQTILPRGLHKKRRQKIVHPHQSRRHRTNIVLNSEQLSAVNAVTQMESGTTLLYGVTGSGKTSVYIELAQKALSSGKSVIILVPEIALTSQLIDEFSHYFTNILLTHSKQTEAERHLVWEEALKSAAPKVVIGPRSALFMPLSNLGLIVIDEAHEPSFKQEQSPRYSALRVASILGRHHHAPLVLGSATPSIADFFIAKKTNRPIIRLTKRARIGTLAPNIQLIDMTKRGNFKAHRFISDMLIRKIKESLASGHQALIFHNRRGSASSTLCEQCGWSAMCSRCFVPLTLHADLHSLRCHICGLSQRVPTECPVCHSVGILHKGFGTKLIEAELRKLFPNKNIVRFDGDSDANNSIEQKYKELYDGDIDIIIGTQIVAKGLDLPNLRTVGIIQADAGLALPDFYASERTFQLLAQVVGRVGRSHHPTSVVVQSYQPSHPAVIDGLKQDYEHFYESTLTQRRQASFPPFVHLLKLTCVYKTEATTIKNAKKMVSLLQHKAPKSVQIFGPAPAFYERQHDTFRWQIVVKSASRGELVKLLEHLPPTHWQFELDPTSLL